MLQSKLPGLKLLARGKVRDLYEVDDKHLLFVATDRISAFDVVMTTPILGKGKILTQISAFWFEKTKDILPNHLVTMDVQAMPASVRVYADQLTGRSMLVKKLKILPIEAIVRGYLTGSGLKEYQKTRTVCGIPLPQGLIDGSRLPTPLFTPSTKAEIGQHDENISPERAGEIIGAKQMERMQDAALKLYSRAAEIALAKGLILADTKFEFGLDETGNMVLADEVLTPDSSRWWPADQWNPGKSQPSFDKQYLRDWLESIKFDKKSGIALPPEVVARTSEKYLEAFRRLTGSEPRL